MPEKDVSHRLEGNLDVFSYEGREIVITPQPRDQDSLPMVYNFQSHNASDKYEGRVLVNPLKSGERVVDDLPTRLRAAKAAFNEVHDQIRQSLYKREA